MIRNQHPVIAERRKQSQNPNGLSRRSFLKATAVASTAFVLGFYLPGAGRKAFAAEEAAAAKPASPDPNAFITINEDNTVTVWIKHLEMGQGITTGLATLVAEEMDADWAKVNYTMAPHEIPKYTNAAFGVMGTGGSTAIATSFIQLRKAGAAARDMLVRAAAEEWDVPAEKITVKKSMVMHDAGKKQATFAELADAAMKLDVPADPALKPASEWTLIGKAAPRLDSNEKVMGKAQFGIDIRRPGMKFAAIRHPDHFGAKITGFDDSKAREVKGVEDIFQISSGVVVVAKDTWTAIKAKRLLELETDLSAAETRSTDTMLDEYRTTIDKGEGVVGAKRGDSAAGLKKAAADKTVEGEFIFPFLNHAAMETLNGVVEVNDAGATLTFGSQIQTIDANVAATVLGIPIEKVDIQTTLAGGSFGRRAQPTGHLAQALAEIGKQYKNKAPVQLVWTREDDVKGGYYRPLAMHKVQASVDDKGKISAWDQRMMAKSIFIGTALEPAFVHDGVDHGQVEGSIDSLYSLENYDLQINNAETPLPVLWWRAVGHTHNAFVMESMMDDLAKAAGMDPVEFRLQYLEKAPRLAAVLKEAVAKSNWGKGMPEGKGIGVACHYSFNTYVAIVAEVSIEDKAIKVDNLEVAVDCGVAVNPDVVTAQAEGSVGFALSTVFRNEITLTDGKVDQSNFYDYEPTRMREMPNVNVYIMKSEEAPTGIGEPIVPPLFPAIANAVFNATGQRLRKMPLKLA